MRRATGPARRKAGAEPRTRGETAPPTPRTPREPARRCRTGSEDAVLAGRRPGPRAPDTSFKPAPPDFFLTPRGAMATLRRIPEDRPPRKSILEPDHRGKASLNRKKPGADGPTPAEKASGLVEGPNSSRRDRQPRKEGFPPCSPTTFVLRPHAISAPTRRPMPANGTRARVAEWGGDQGYAA